MAKPRTANIMKLIAGTQRRDRTRDEKRTTPSTPLDNAPPEIVTLDERERAVFDWLIQNGRVHAVHRAIDVLHFAQIAVVWVRLELCNAKVRQHGPVMRVEKLPPTVQPYAREARQLIEVLRALLSDAGLSLQGRLKAAPPMSSTTQRQASDWDSID